MTADNSGARVLHPLVPRHNADRSHRAVVVSWCSWQWFLNAAHRELRDESDKRSGAPCTGAGAAPSTGGLKEV